MYPLLLIVIFGAVIVASLLAAPRRASIEGFFGGMTTASFDPVSRL